MFYASGWYFASIDQIAEYMGQYTMFFVLGNRVLWDYNEKRYVVRNR